MHTLETNLAAVRERIAAAAARAGRKPGEITLVAVTKGVGAEVAADLARLGQLDLGESRADELERKAERLGAVLGQGLPRWHFVGHLQTNKVRRVVALSASVHSVDSLRLLEAVDRAAEDLAARREVWIQVKLADEPAKSGVSPRELPALLERAAALRNVDLAGLMTMAPLGELGGAGGRDGAAGSAARDVFRELSRLARELAPRAKMRDALHPGRMRTSMGMSGDFEAAIEAGSDLVRIGTLLFEGLGASGRAERGPASRGAEAERAGEA